MVDQLDRGTATIYPDVAILFKTLLDQKDRETSGYLDAIKRRPLSECREEQDPAYQRGREIAEKNLLTIPPKKHINPFPLTGGVVTVLSYSETEV